MRNSTQRAGSARQALIAVALLAGLALGFVSCKRKEAVPERGKGETGPSTGAFAKRFDDPRMQRQFEVLAAEQASVFVPIRPGRAVSIALTNGATMFGEFRRVEGDEITLAVTNGEVVLSRSIIAPEYRARFFAGDFAVAKALLRMNAPATAPGNASKLEERFVVQEAIDVRVGPDENYKLAASGDIAQGQRVYVVDEADEWILVKRDPAEPGPAGWIRKFTTRVPDEGNAALLEKDVNELIALGYVQSIRPDLNEAFVDGIRWSTADPQSRVGMSRALAFYCGVKKGTGLNWITVKDGESGRRVAKYSESKGYLAIQ